jgi:hypothetical protein
MTVISHGKGEIEMSKQDGYSPRTAVDLERRYKFGQTFAEVYNLVTDARKAAEEAQNAFEGLNQEQIFNLLTNFGEAQGIYRDDNGDVYVNASYIKSGKLAAEYIDATNLKVAAANITGTLTASQIDVQNLKVAAGNITGKLTAGQIDATNLKVSAANVTGTLTIGQLPSTVAETSDIPTKTSQLTNDSKYQTESGVTTIVKGVVTTDYVNALGVYASELVSEGSRYWQKVSIANGCIDLYSGTIYDDSYGSITIEASDVLNFLCGSAFRFHMPNGNYWELDGTGMNYYAASGSYINGFQFANL